MCCCSKCKGCCDPCIIKLKAFMEKARVPFLIIGLIITLADIVTDGNTCHIFFVQGHVIWGTLTLLFMLLPMIAVSVGGIYQMFIDTDGGDNPERPLLVKVIFLLGAVILAPLVAVGFLVLAVVMSIRGDEGGADGTGMLKLTESMLEALPQTCLQSYIMAQYLIDDNETIAGFQWVTLTFSLLSLTVTIATNSYYHEKASASNRCVWFVFGLVSVISRVLVCCLFSQVAKPLWLLPCSTMLLITLDIWAVKRFSGWAWPVPLNTEIHHTADPLSILMIIPMTVTITTVFNSFTLSGISIASATLAYAIGATFLVPGPLAIAAVTLAALSLVANLLMVAIPTFRVVGEEWLEVDDEGRSALI